MLRRMRLASVSVGQHGGHVQWGLLLLLSILVTLPLELLHLPAALLLGPMIAAILVAAGEASVRVPQLPFILAQGVIGALIARSLSPSILGEMIHDWPLLLATAFSVILAANGLGYLLARQQILPGTTAIWGSSPGAATAQVLMAAAYGGDMRLVAFMQYLRIVLVAGFASAVARIWLPPAATAAAAIDWFPPVAWLPLTETLAVGWGCVLIAQRLRMPAGALLLPLIVAAILQGMGVLTIELPPWLLAVSYALVGWSIGLHFTRPILVHAGRVLPKVLLSILSLMAICGLFAAILTFAAGIDPLTAYLATSPGGADSIAIIAVSSRVDVPFIMALQTARFLLVVVTGPSVSRFVVRRMGILKEQM
ncbi:AbrB family transcriptional regulator [Methyloferula stellata]|uniref:AbrB family transcriptional regulator n=1 Tax=Methyloferula stellata TaxID=876270 RepID=UPI00039B4777|nr:AbrB family transcriptional regulator [Methyloferula stellata]